MKTENFVHLHVHSEYSLLDGAARIKDIVSKAKYYDMKAVALTDHGAMYGAVEFYKECKKQGIKPITGCEVYVAARTRFDKENEDRKSGHLILLCKNEIGYHNLIKIVSDAYKTGFYYKPRTDREMLEKHKEGLICLSGCLAGFVQKYLLEDRYEDAKKEALEMKRIFGDDFYLEVQDHGSEDDTVLLPRLKKLGKELDIPFVATNDSHYVEKEDAKIQEVLLCVNMQQSIHDPNRKLFEGAEEYYFKSPKEMRVLFSNFDGACDNTGIIADKCNFDFEFGHYHIPEFHVPASFKTTTEYFRHLCIEGFGRRYENPTNELKDRLEYEMSTIESMGYVEYFLIVWDYINYAKENGISVGPGRGSAAGSVVAYSLGITDIEPLKYSLIFERFLNPERISMPDIDTDFCVDRRGEVIEYVARKYGKDNVCQISTIGRLKAKNAIKNVARVYDMPFAQANKLSKLIPNEPNITIDRALEESEDFRNAYDEDEQVKEIIDMAKRLEGLACNTGTHAAGVVISRKAVDEYVPLVKGEKGLATQFNMGEIEELGLLKMDFLGLRNLTAIQNCLKIIKDGRGIDVDIEKISFEDQNVFDMISKGKTVGVFQLESKGMTDFMKKLKPSSLEDIIAGIALYRPGPMDSIPTYIANKRHPDKIKYIDKHLEPILSVTYGCIVYQEQVMQIVRDLAGYSFGRSDLVRKAMSKKKADVMMEEREYFINGKLDENGNIEIPGCIRNGISKEAAEEIFDEMTSFAQYAFNKSHAAAYAYVAYRTAWLRCYYPAEFFAALMSSEADNHDHLDVYIKSARKTMLPGKHKRINVLPPDITASKADFSVTEDGDILFGLSAIKGVGAKSAEKIAAMNTSDINGLNTCLRRDPLNTMSAKEIEGLAKAGAFKNLGFTSATVLKNYKPILEAARKEKKIEGQISFDEMMANVGEKIYKDPDNEEEYPETIRLANEKEVLGTYISGHPLKRYSKIIKNEITASAADIEEGKCEEQEIFTIGIIKKVKKIVTRKGDPMAFADLEDANDTFSVTIFPKTYKQYSSLLVENEVILVKGKVENSQVLANKLFNANEYLKEKKEVEKTINKTKKVVWIRCKNAEEISRAKNFIEKLKEGEDSIAIYDEYKERGYRKDGYLIDSKKVDELIAAFGKEKIAIIEKKED